jgi:hypothetical protein
LKDIAARWDASRLLRNSAAFAANTDPNVKRVLRNPDAQVYAIDVPFLALKDKAEFDYLSQQPTSFVLPAEAVDRLRAAAGTIIMASPECQRLLKDVGAKLVAGTAGCSKFSDGAVTRVAASCVGLDLKARPQLSSLQRKKKAVEGTAGVDRHPPRLPTATIWAVDRARRRHAGWTRSS